MSESVRISMIAPRDLDARLLERAQREERIVSAELRVAIREHVAKDRLQAETEPAATGAR